jgi:hypothetical protein
MVIESTTWNTFILPCTKRPRYRTQNCFGRQACDFKPTTNSDGNNINTYQNQHLHNLQRWYKQQPMRYKKHARTDGKLKAKLAIDALKRRTCFRICWWIGSGGIALELRWKKRVCYMTAEVSERYVSLQHEWATRNNNHTLQEFVVSSWFIPTLHYMFVFL